jgi:flagellar hook-associated protein 1
MGMPNLSNIGLSGLMASKAAITTTGHNISNSNTEGFSRQRVETETNTPQAYGNRGALGTGTMIGRVSRTNDEYLEKQIRESGRDMSHLEEKQMALRQTEDIFNEMNGDGLNRVVSKFFNEFRKLANEPESPALRQAVREASSAVVDDFHRLRSEVDQVRKHIDSRIEGYTGEVNSDADGLRELNQRILLATASKAPANDLEDKRDLVLKKISTYMDVASHKDEHGNVVVDIRGVGPLVAGPEVSKFTVERTGPDDQGKPTNAFDLRTDASASEKVTHRVHGGKLGALLEVRDEILSTVVDRLDDMAFSLSTAVNEIHSNGVTRSGDQGIAFFKNLGTKDRASEYIGLSEAVNSNINNIATAVQHNAPGDNRIALAIAGLQDQKLMNGGTSTADEFYNSIVSDVGVASGSVLNKMNQQKDIMLQLDKMRDQVSGVSIDEETANLMQFQHIYDASAKVIAVADEMLKTVLELKR